MSLRHVPSSFADTLGKWLVYKTKVCDGSKWNGSLYFFSASIGSTLQSCFTIPVLRRVPSSSSEAMINLLPLSSAISGLTFLLQFIVNASAEILPE